MFLSLVLENKKIKKDNLEQKLSVSLLQRNRKVRLMENCLPTPSSPPNLKTIKYSIISLAQS